MKFDHWEDNLWQLNGTVGLNGCLRTGSDTLIIYTSLLYKVVDCYGAIHKSHHMQLYVISVLGIFSHF